MRILEAAQSAPWAMLPERVEEVLQIAARENEATPEVLEAYRSRAIAAADRMTIRDGVAILPVVGPLFRRANLFTEISGATSYDMLRRDLQIAIDDPAVRAIMLNVDSPGGEANGCNELAKAVFEARGVKRVVAYVGGMAASGGYWIASAASEVVIDEAAILGSIGVALGVEDASERDRARGVRRIEFVSSQSPGKRPDPATDDGRARLQRMVDGLADVFIGAVAKHRGVSEQTVIDRFGQGGVETGVQAVKAGMADRIGTFEGVLADLSRASSGRPSSQNRRASMDTNTETAPAADAQIASARREGEAAGAAAERTRFVAIIGAEGVSGVAARISAAVDLAAKSPAMSADDVVAFVTANVVGEPAASEPASAPVASLRDRVQAAAGGGNLPAADQGGRQPVSIDRGEIFDARRSASAK